MSASAAGIGLPLVFVVLCLNPDHDTNVFTFPNVFTNVLIQRIVFVE